MLLLGSIYAVSHHLWIVGVIAVAAAGAIIGDSLGFWAGRRGGRPLLKRFGRYLRLDEKHFDQAEKIFRDHGDKMVFFGRFVAVLRAWAAFWAGVNKMHYPKFLLYNAAGGIIWAALYGLLGYYIGSNLPLLHKIVRDFGFGSIAVVAMAIAIIYLRHRQKKKLLTDN